MPVSWTPDQTQQQIIDIDNGQHLVLAPPGCGKTQILAERIRIALDHGVKPEDMLCLTFTNRAARGMRERINESIGGEGSEDIFVGNIHRFCSRFLFSNNIVPAESAIIDDEVTISILARYLNEDELQVAQNFRRRKAYSQIMFFSHFMYDIEHELPKELRMHPECVSKEDVAVLKAIAKTQDKPFDSRMMLDVYNHTDYYLDLIHQPSFNPLLRNEAEQTLLKMRYAHAYTAYKRLNNLLDFEDLLQLTYNTLSEDRRPTTNDQEHYKRYPWIQVDEVQDLNMLQLAIINKLSTTGLASLLPKGDGKEERSCLLFLGDEQQAIFSFMGAKLTTLNVLKDKCKGNIHHLGINHRSPKRLLEMLNTYAVVNLKSDPSLLPLPSDKDETGCELQIIGYDNIFAEFRGVAKFAASLIEKSKTETTAIIVNSNKDADEISNALFADKQSHFKISGTDLFSTPEVKLLFAHLSVLHNDHNFLAWSLIMAGLKVCDTPASARQFVHQLRKVAVTPSDFLIQADLSGQNDQTLLSDPSNCKTYLHSFLETYETKDIVVFDTETTGLNVFEDDIIQIAAERIRQGKSIDKFCVYIETDREIPKMLGDIVNPILEERKHQKIYSHAEALQMFLDFVGDSPLLAHNAAFDSHILDYNLRKYVLPDVGVDLSSPSVYGDAFCLDSLKLIRLIRPDLHAFKLKILLKELGLEGENSHLADDDVNATVSLVNYCYEKGKEILPQQEEYLKRKTTIDRIGKLQRNYGEYYRHGVSRLYIRNSPSYDANSPSYDNKMPSYDSKTPLDEVPAMVDELRYFYHSLEELHWIKPIDKIDYIFRFLTYDVLGSTLHEGKGRGEVSLIEQLDAHMMEINTFKEADLCGSSTITDRLFVSTIHKAKGLEFDNVFVFDVVDGRIPNYYNENNPAALAEDARKLYVAMSRVRKRLFVCYSRQAQSQGMPERRLSRFMEPVKKYFG